VNKPAGKRKNGRIALVEKMYYQDSQQGPGGTANPTIR
jgi:hypothetical protein